MSDVASPPADLTRRLQVIGAGLPRTGTVSMAMAYEKLLDGPVMHGGTQLLNREDAYPRLWARVFDAKFKGDKALTLQLLREATAGFVAITDYPGVCFIAELQELYPEALVVLVNRDKDRWYKSFEMVAKEATPPKLRFLLAPVPTWRWFPYIINCIIKAELARLSVSSYLTPDLLTLHLSWVRDCTPADRFCEVDLKEGWVPLCRVLNKPVPDEPFPRVNDADSVTQQNRRICAQAWMVWRVIFAAAGFLVGAGCYLLWVRL
ncbi:hypothetical protein N658DRAFT_506507 [Parathielavia hyrcaniae]|uniref:P-loop containing nucleoside triphosphate hydrolase protein n=1 Tax=Parathielavia hyrcaniae TaxID=113614 RepID=A0AAN6Q5S9_9PEZI|nr:hypothetical protein N658DRAFT_506507 [Parathielavia hyrcaniae]